MRIFFKKSKNRFSSFYRFDQTKSFDLSKNENCDGSNSLRLLSYLESVFPSAVVHRRGGADYLFDGMHKNDEAPSRITCFPL